MLVDKQDHQVSSVSEDLLHGLKLLDLAGGAQEFVRGPHNPHVRPLRGRTGPGGKWSMHGMTAALSTPPRGQHAVWMD